MKLTLTYTFVLLTLVAGTWLMLEAGARFNRQRPAAEAAQSVPADSAAAARPGSPAPAHAGGGLREKLKEPLAILLTQLAVIIIVARLFGWLFRKVGQPSVIGEMVAGIVLGPSALGALSPATGGFLFPASSMGVLGLLSQVGVILYMFVVGMELNARHLREGVRTAILVSHSGIVVPFLLGGALSAVIYRSAASAEVPFTAFALFVGTAMSITAFPVLARILEEKGMSKSRLGSTAIACAAVDDVTAWCLLAFVVAVVRAEGVWAAVPTVILAGLFAAFMLLVLRPRLGRRLKGGAEEGTQGRGLAAAVLPFVFACAWFTETVGVHAFFGAFLAGVVMPEDAGLRSHLRGRLEALSTGALLPVFFAFTGLRTQLSLLGDWQSWLMCGAIIAVATVSKLGGGALAARWTGMNWRDSLSLGVLMNTRGLMELIVLNIGYDLGVLPARIFSMMVFMAIITTLMAGPLLSRLNFKAHGERALLSASSPNQPVDV
ncbi:MAG TPA: cation:proton antiporter [Pyrinomonadaceae bacterium]|nr:cation:proton antiporter [Pyrinomonadaceae bacterium]